MHSFRLRYVVLGLLVLIVATCGRRRRQSATSSCGTRFTDPTSSAIRSAIVVHAQFLRLRYSPDTADTSTGHVAIFRVRAGKVLKGSVANNSRGRYKPLSVSWFTENTADVDCSAPLPSKGHRYILFLKQTPGGNSSDYSLDSLPVKLPKDSRSLRYKKLAKETRKGLCKKCVRKLAIVYIKVIKHKRRTGRAITFRCKVIGRPRARITWIKNGRRVRKSKRIRIRSKKTIYSLRLNSIKKKDSGTYICRAENVLGKVKSKKTRIRIRKASLRGATWNISHEMMHVGAFSRTHLTTTTSLSSTPEQRIRVMARRSSSGVNGKDRIKVEKDVLQHSSNCASNDFCFNGGKCYKLKSNKSMFCRCSTKYAGFRCETRTIDGLVRDLEIRNSHKIDRTLTHIGLSIGAITLLVLCSVAYCMARDKRKTFEKHNALIQKLKSREEKVVAETQTKFKRPLLVNNATQTYDFSSGGKSFAKNSSLKQQPPPHNDNDTMMNHPRQRLTALSAIPPSRRLIAADIEPPHRVQSVDDHCRNELLDNPVPSSMHCTPPPPRSRSLHQSLAFTKPVQVLDQSSSCHAELSNALAFTPFCQIDMAPSISEASSIGEERRLFDRLLASKRTSMSDVDSDSTVMSMSASSEILADLVIIEDEQFESKPLLSASSKLLDSRNTPSIETIVT